VYTDNLLTALCSCQEASVMAPAKPLTIGKHSFNGLRPVRPCLAEGSQACTHARVYFLRTMIKTAQPEAQRPRACTSCGPASLRNVALVCAAHARASSVLPVPGGPYSSTPLGGLMPSDLKRSCAHTAPPVQAQGRAAVRHQERSRAPARHAGGRPPSNLPRSHAYALLSSFWRRACHRRLCD